MAFQNAYIPYGGYWCTPFVRWQGNFASLHPVRFAGEIAVRALAERKIAASEFRTTALEVALEDGAVTVLGDDVGVTSGVREGRGGVRRLGEVIDIDGVRAGKGVRGTGRSSR